MARPTRLLIEPSALLHNLERIKQFSPQKKIVAMVKANAYGCGLQAVIPVLEGHVDAFGVACIEEALTIRHLGSRTPCILFQGVFSADEYNILAEHRLDCVIHQPHQLHWLLNTPLKKSIKLWVKVNTGMHRLGFDPSELTEVMSRLQRCPWVDKNIGLMSHMACADEPDRIENKQQIALFNDIALLGFNERSLANSAAVISLPQAHFDVIRPGIMLYGVSPFMHIQQTSNDLGLIPVMRFVSAISAVHDYPVGAQVGYGGAWKTSRPSRIGVVAAGYGDGYPRHIKANTPVWIKGREIMIAGRISMDMLTVDLTDYPDVFPGEPVELWGQHVLVERIAQSAGTIAYELLCQISERVRHT